MSHPSNLAFSQTPLTITAIIDWVFIDYISYLARHLVLIISLNSNHNSMRGFLLHTFDKRSTQHLKNTSDVTHIHSASTWPSQDSISDSLSTTVHTACIHRGPAASPIYWTISGKFRHSHPCANAQKIPSFCCVPRCLQTLFLQNFILAVGLTHEVKLGYCRLIYYAFCAIHK